MTEALRRWMAEAVGNDPAEWVMEEGSWECDSDGESPGWSVCPGRSGYVVTRTNGWYTQTGDAGCLADLEVLVDAMNDADCALNERLFQGRVAPQGPA